MRADIFQPDAALLPLLPIEVREKFEQCVRCAASSVTNLDGDFLCQDHADRWVRSEGRAAAETDHRDAVSSDPLHAGRPS